MKKKLAIAILLSLAFATAHAQVAVKYGEGPGLVNYINQNKYPGLEEPVPYGPLSFRIEDGHFWVADSVGGKLLKLNSKGVLVSEISLLPPNQQKPIPAFKNDPCMQILIEDFAFVKGDYGQIKSIWAVDSFDNKLINVSLDGKIIKEIENPSFIQLERIEVGLGGHLFVSDKGAQKIFVFDAKHNLVSATHWEWSGFAITPQKEHLHRLFFTHESGKLTLVTTDMKAVVLSETELDLPVHLNPELWWVDEYNGNFVMSYTPQTGFDGRFVVVKMGFDGQVKASGEIEAPIALTRYIQHWNYEGIWVAKANHNNAPTENFRIVPFSFTKNKTGVSDE